MSQENNVSTRCPFSHAIISSTAGFINLFSRRKIEIYSQQTRNTTQGVWHSHTCMTHDQINVWLVRRQECIWIILKDHIQPPIRSWGSGAAAWGMGIISLSVYPLGRSPHSTSTSPSAWCLTALCNVSVCSTHWLTLAHVLKWPHLCSARTVARPFVF